LKRFLVLLFSLLLLTGFVLGCSSSDTGSDANDANNETVDKTKEDSDTSGGDSADAQSLGIELRSHDFDEAEEEIEDLDDGEGYSIKHGTNLTLPDEFPSDFPIAEGMTVDSVIIGESGTVLGDKVEVWFNDGGNYTLEQLNALYEGYIHSGFDDVEVKDLSQYMTDLTSYEGTIDEKLYVIGISPESNHNVVTIVIHNDPQF